MKVALFGATGKTGKYLIEEGLKRGIDITVFARSQTPFTHPYVRVVRGDLTDTAALQDAIRGTAAVLSALGPTSLAHAKDMPITHATRSIISAMQTENVDRLIAVSTGTAPDPGDKPDWKIWLPALFIKHAMPGSYRDIVELAKAIRASSLNWTLVRAAVLSDQPASERLNVGLYGHAKHSLTLSRADLAAFMFDQVTNRESFRTAPGISTAK